MLSVSTSPRYVPGCPDLALSRFAPKVAITPGACWIWLAATDGQGYGQFYYGEVRVQAHRWSYVFHMRQEIPAGAVLDHLCRTPRCVNPWHLEPVTQHENTMRGDAPTARNAAKTHCTKGHPFSEENTRIKMRDGRPGRVCRICNRRQKTEARRRTPC